MATREPLIVTIPKNRRVDVQVGAHVLHTDQPLTNGGEDSAPSPYDLFLASIGACAGIFVQGFCAARKLPTDDVRVIEQPHFDEKGVLKSVDLRVEVPPDFPERYRDALIHVVEQCSVKKAIAAQPEFAVSVEAIAAIDAA